ncbi:hypothetical protein IDH50_01905 [Aeromicrobium tamlense]|uniref:Type I restriction enzyme S subunit n=1 Tax=Aeromicrobium tamlense TaxID=375541 RepID=A0A8I0FW13_9ACTN|nr:hypothetical protein [Aeromicrobium tamlense]MBD1268977.1 hypothetical protein [Aeromicrobium tamlense]NYI37115.1 type I restriction enzyme S subunit [Aeromicrobium tamlense]
MSAWFRGLPHGWQSTRLDRVARSWPSNVDKHSVEGQPAVRLCNYTDVYKNSAITSELEFMRATATEEQVDRFRLCRGDTLITKDSETADDIGIPAFVETEANDLVCGYHLAMVRPTRRIDPKYLYWALSSEPTMRQWSLLATGVTRVGIKSGDLARVEVAVPTALSVQRAIADYLDRETSQIDNLIHAQQCLIDLLRERTDAAWGTAYDRLHASYPVLPLRRVIESIVDGPFGSSLTSSHYSDEGTRVIRLGNIGVNDWRDQDKAFIPMDYATELSQHAVTAGDVVVAGLGDERWPLGRATVVPEIGPAIVKADCYRLRPNSLVSPAYLAWALSSPSARTQMALLSRGSTRARLNTAVVRDVLIPVPPQYEQDIVSETSARTDRVIEEIIAEAERFIELSKERRSALITAAVTGQVDVSEAA